MATIYRPPGSVNVWLCDDDMVACDGYFESPGHVGYAPGHVPVDGDDPTDTEIAIRVPGSGRLEQYDQRVPHTDQRRRRY